MSDLTADCLRMLRDFRRGRLQAYFADEERREQMLSYLSKKRRGLAQALLDLPNEEKSQEEFIESVGPERAYKALQRVLRAPGPPRYVANRLYPYVSCSVRGVTWMLERIDVGVTGLNLRTALWTRWPASIQYSALPQFPDSGAPLRHRASWWSRFEQVTDDRGTEYHWIGGIVKYINPVIIETGGRRMVRVSQLNRETWIPGPPPEARKLLLTPHPTIRVERPKEGVPPWPTEELPLGDRTWTIDI